MSDAALAHPALKPCGFTRDKLDDLNAKHFQQPAWSSYFFNNVTGSAIRSDGTQKYPRRDDVEDDTPRCNGCGCTIGEHRCVAAADPEALKTSPKRRRDEAWKLSIRITKGASCQHLRLRLYRLAEDHLARCGYIAYEAPVTATSDLVAELYFGSRERAEVMETVVVQAVRDRWRSPNIPQTIITGESIDILSLRRVFAHHHDQASSQPDRLRFDCIEADEHSAATTVLDAEEIARESVVDPSMTRLKFEKCHIDSSITGTESDTTGNHIPLPSDWHDLFDANTSDNVASISIVAAVEEKGAAQSESDGRAPVIVHVYFDPFSPDAPQRATQLRAASMVRPNVFAVTVWKEQAPVFVANLQKRHDAVVQHWRSIP